MEGAPERKPAGSHRELTAEELGFRVPADWIGFATTDEVPPEADWIGQERALAALELGLRVRHPGYNIYVSGLQGTHREQILADLLKRFTADQPTPGDRVLVQNFKNHDRPRALYLQAGWGLRLQKDLRELVEELRTVLPKTFREETFEEEKERISEKFGEEGEAINRTLAEHATKAGFVLQPGPEGQILFIPLKEGRPMEPQELEGLSDDEKTELRRRQKELSREVKAVLRQQRMLLGKLSREVKAAERRVAAEVVGPLIDELVERYPHEGLAAYLAEVREEILDHIESFQEQPAQPSMPMAFFLGAGVAAEDTALDYEVNVLVDNGNSEGAPILVESSPTYRNLFGAVERMVDRYGKLVTNFTRVTAGSILRAHGGCIVLNIVEALSEPLVWRALKRALKTGELEIEAYDPFALFATSALKPEPMVIDTRVVLTGPAEIFQLLYIFDEEFQEIFKVLADFGAEADADAARRNFVSQAARIAREDELLPFTAGAVARLMELSARAVGDRRKLPSQWRDLADLMREAAYWAKRRGGPRVDVEDVEQGVEQRRFRLGRIEEKIREMIRDGTLLVDVAGERIGQVNGLAVLDMVGYSFGRPSRITAAVSMGTQGVIAVDREAKMSGKTYDKAVFIITGYLRQTYAQTFPLSLSASLSFEQSYSGIDGDSASAAEIFVLISSLAGLPLRQDVAVTGSANQFGDVQPIGGVNEKIEGFFYTCKEVGLTGGQGVMIPARNVDNVILAPEVVQAVCDGQFRIYPVRTIDEGLELLTGVKAGSVGEEGTVHYLAARRLRELAEGLRRFEGPSRKGSSQPTDESSSS